MRMKDGRDLYRGSQIAYIPDHAKEVGLNHPDVEFGFVNSLREDGTAAFCRYWSKSNPAELRTKANSERTNISDIFIWVSHPQSDIDAAIAAIDKGVW